MNVYTAARLLVMLHVVCSEACLRQRYVYLGAPAVDVCAQVYVHVCNNRRVLYQHVAPPAIRVSHLKLFCAAQVLSPFPNPQSAFLLSLFFSSSLLPVFPHIGWHTLLPPSIAPEVATPPCSSSYFWLLSILYNHPFLPQASNFGLRLHASNYRDSALYWCQTVSPLSLLFPCFLPFPLSGPGRLGYALITLRILPSCQPPCSRLVTAQGHHWSTEKLWVSMNRVLDQPISRRYLCSRRKGLVWSSAGAGGKEGKHTEMHTLSTCGREPTHKHTFTHARTWKYFRRIKHALSLMPEGDQWHPSEDWCKLLVDKENSHRGVEWKITRWALQWRTWKGQHLSFL